MAKVDAKLASVDKQLAEIFDLNRCGKSERADKLSVELLDDVESEIAVLKDKVTQLENRLSLIRGIAPKGQMSIPGVGSARQSAKLTKSEKRKRREEILRVARKVGTELEVFSSEDVARVLLDEGVNMGVQPNRVNTAIGAFLRSHTDFERDKEEAGLFLYRSRVDPQDESGEDLF